MNRTIRYKTHYDYIPNENKKKTNESGTSMAKMNEII